MHKFRLRRRYRDGGAPRKRMSYANIASTLALVLALGGGTAWAAHHYSITSTKQIKPSVLKTLHGARGKNGTNGATGVTGVTGQAGPLTTSLPAGQTLRGWFNLDTVAAAASQINGGSISFGFNLASAPTVQLVPVGGPTTAQCGGSVAAPSAAPGYLCLYESSLTNVASLAVCNSVGTCGPSADSFGGELFANSTAAGRFFADGAWAVTAS
jgi:hypothetical protein